MASEADDARIVQEIEDPARITVFADERVEQHDIEALQRVLGRRRSARRTSRSAHPSVAKYSSEG